MREKLTKAILNPSSVAVIGASRHPEKAGHVILRNIVESGFRGKVYPVNPKADTILGLKCYPSVLDIPDEVDVAIVAVPARIVPEVVAQCGEKGIPLVVVISAGFKETGPEGAKLERSIVEIARKYGIRILGPNCLGFMNLSVPINATFAAVTPKRGNIALISQSGALITALLDIAVCYGVGFSMVFSLGNKADLDEVDLLEVLSRDPATQYIIMYIESIERGREFISVARSMCREKILIALKAGVTERGARAVSSHTGSLAGKASIYFTAFRQAGVVQIQGLRELVSILQVLTRGDLLRLGKPRVVIVTNAGGPGIIATDCCEKLGVELVNLDRELIEKLRSILPPAAALHNPVDVLGDATPDRFESTLRVLLSSPQISYVILIATPQAMTNPPELAERIIKLSSEFRDKVVLPVLLGGETMREAREKLMKKGIPTYDAIEDSVEALSALSRYFDVTKVIEEAPTVLPVNVAEIAEIISRARAEGRKVLLVHEALEVASKAGIPIPPGGLAKTVAEAVAIAREVGYPVALKIVSPDIVHKSDVGGVKLNLANDEEVRRAFTEIVSNVHRYAPYARIYGVYVHKMVQREHELYVGSTRDPHFGPVILFGLGGIYVELFRDVSMRIAPISRREAYRMLYETKAGMIVSGYRGSRPGDIDKIVEVLLRVSSLMVQVEDIVELDVNPLLVSGNSVYAVDVKIIVR